MFGISAKTPHMLGFLVSYYLGFRILKDRLWHRALEHPLKWSLVWLRFFFIIERVGMFNKLYALRYRRDYITTFSVLSAAPLIQRGSNAQNKRAQSVLTFMARMTSTLLNGLRFTLRKALLSYMLTLTLCLQEYHISFLHALQTICYMGDPSPWRRRSSSVMDRHLKLSSPNGLRQV